MAFRPNGLFVETDDRSSGDDDDISLTSTVEEGGDYDVEELLFEREDPQEPGKPQFLIKWAGYPLDQCTWEPREHLGHGVYEVWEETKSDIKAGKRQPFDMQIYYDAFEKASVAKAERHARRNAKRRRLGFPLTEPLPVESPATTSIASMDDSDQGGEAVESNEIDPGQPSKPSPKPAQKIIKQKTFQGIPSPKPQNEALVSSTSVPKFSGKTAVKPLQDTPKPRPGTTSSTITGYKGTARPSASRKSSMNSDAGSPTSPTSRQRVPLARKSSGSAPSGSAPSGSAPSGSAAAPPKSSSLRDKFSGKKATRTRTERQAIPNVFSSGKVRQQRKNLKENMVDPSKDPKPFSNMRLRGIARKKGNEMNDAAPLNISAIPAAFILTGETGSKDQKENQAGHSARSPGDQPTPPTPVTSTGLPGISDGAAPAKKPKKSVRFEEADDMSAISTLPDDFDPVLSERLGSPPAVLDSSVTATNTNTKKKLSLAKYQGRSSVQTIAKPCSFGHNGSRVIQAKFSNIPRQNQEWLPIFQEEEVLDFHLICSSDDFMSQRAFLCQEILASGSVEAESESEESAPDLENVAEHMRRRSSGLYTAKLEYSILVYPLQCDSWTGVAGDHTQQTTSQSSLGYLIFKSAMDIKQYPNHPEGLGELIDEENKSTMEKLVKVMMDLDFSTLTATAPGPQAQANPVFMLIFPLEDIQLLRAIALWLRNCEPKCRIFSSELKGSFAKFIECTKRAPANATVILHEEVTNRIRRIPLIFQLVDRGYNFYSLATGRRTPPRFPSLPGFDLKPNQHAITRLFSHGRAFLITPSFVISDPIKFYDFIQWFSVWCQNPRYLIAASTDFLHWLQSLCMEKGRELMRHQAGTLRGAALDRLLSTCGLSRDRTDALVKAWILLKRIMNDYGDGATYGDEAAYTGMQRVIWAPREINPNDEQSLVNWFFWWSTISLDRHRRFYVLGSNAKYQRRAYRTVRVPNYDPEQTLDPEKLNERNRLKGEAEEHEILAYWDAQFVEPTLDGTAQSDSHQNANVATNTAPASGFPTKLFKSDRAIELGNWLKELDRDTKSLWVTPFWQPVSWEDVKMADHFGDPFCEYANFNHWLSSCKEFSSRLNTWAGLFYTPDGDWDHTKPASTYTRHPWIAVVRPVNPHRKLPEGYGPMELFLWDPAVDKPANLSDIQIRLVDFVQREAARLVSPRYYLEKVWCSNKLGNFVSPQDHPLDIACLHLKEMIHDTRRWLPPLEQILPTRGWSRLRLPYVAQRKSGGVEHEPAVPQAKGHQQPFPKHSSDEGEPPAMVWLPPRGTSQRFECYNDLYEAAYRHRVKNAWCREFPFTYRPTTEWYDQQKREGRGCSHVCVDAGDRILEGLPKGDKKSK